MELELGIIPTGNNLLVERCDILKIETVQLMGDPSKIKNLDIVDGTFTVKKSGDTVKENYDNVSILFGDNMKQSNPVNAADMPKNFPFDIKTVMSSCFQSKIGKYVDFKKDYPEHVYICVKYYFIVSEFAVIAKLENKKIDTQIFKDAETTTLFLNKYEKNKKELLN